MSSSAAIAGCSKETETESEAVACFETLPLELMTYIFNCFTYEDICNLRGVSRTFDFVARSILNSAFFRLGDQLDKAITSIKKMLPKRESERRLHPLSRVNEVYSALETRYALLCMTFRKYIDDDSCCFIAGKVLDEGFAVLQVLDDCVQRKEQPRETQHLLRNIRDYSSMAMEYFDEQIAPKLRCQNPLGSIYRSRYSLGSSQKTTSFSPMGNSIIGRLSMCCSRPMSTPNTGLSSSPTAAGSCNYVRLYEWKRDVDEKLTKHERIIAEQDRMIREQNRAINGLIGYIHQTDPTISFSWLKEVKTAEELSQPPFACSSSSSTPASASSLSAPEGSSSSQPSADPTSSSAPEGPSSSPPTANLTSPSSSAGPSRSSSPAVPSEKSKNLGKRKGSATAASAGPRKKAGKRCN